MKYCKKCGAEITESASFCGNCGNPVGNVSKSGKGKKNGIIVGGIGVIVLAVLVMVILFAEGIFGDKSHETGVSSKNGSAQEKNKVECFDEFINLTYEVVVSKYRDYVIDKDNIMEADISDWLKNNLSDDMRDEQIYINYKLPGFEGDTLLYVEHMYLEWVWWNYLPEGETIDDHKENYDALVHDFTEKYGEPYKKSSEDGEGNMYTIIKQGYKVGTYYVFWEKGYDENYKCDRYVIGVKFGREESESYVGDGNSDASEDEHDDSEDGDWDEDEDTDEDEYEDENW